ncbi:protein C12orf4-like [Thrips palmi]|uniref:Protein C12orf4-like n=1 Tax=Thrips palmi TaxID=161013 RepID=A0A6P9A6L5_THRPL|nr:protein C12orf4-like [Thrips palmi]
MPFYDEDWQAKEMSDLVAGIGEFSTEADVNLLAARHCEDQNMIQAKINSQIDSLQETQRREYRDWLMKLLEEQAEEASSVTPPTPSPTHIVRHLSNDVSSKDKGKGGSDISSDVGNNPGLEESFTIHLGSQMKQMHNIRIMSADVLHLCKTHLSSKGGMDMQPQRLQTALALYSNDLCGLVLLTDGLISSFSGTTKDFISVCQQSTEFHFPSIDDQLEKIREGVKETVARRQEHWIAENLSISSQQWRRASSSGALRSVAVAVAVAFRTPRFACSTFLLISTNCLATRSSASSSARSAARASTSAWKRPSWRAKLNASAAAAAARSSASLACVRATARSHSDSMLAIISSTLVLARSTSRLVSKKRLAICCSASSAALSLTSALKRGSCRAASKASRRTSAASA